MTTRPYELLARFGNDGTVAGVSVRTITTINGKEFESDPTPLSGASDPAFVAFAEQFSAAIVAENETLKADKAKLTTDLAAKTTAYDAEVVKVTKLTAEKATLTTEKATLTEQLTQANATIATLQARIAALEAIRQFNPRWTTPDYFINRFTAKEAKEFYSSEDAMIVGGQQLLEAYEQAGYYVDLDDTQVQGLTGYMVQLGMLTAERREQVLRDATAAEAWYPE
jgi:hypothetical protein